LSAKYSGPDNGIKGVTILEGFTIIDGAVAVVIIISALLAYSRGFVREALSIAGWVAAAMLAFLFADQVQPLIQEIPLLDKIIKDSCELGRVAAFFVVLVGGLVVMSLFTPLFSSLVQRSILGGLDQGLGFLFGVVRGAVLVAVALVVYDRVITSQNYPIVDDSRTARLFARIQDDVNDAVPDDAPGWFVERYNGLIGSCNAN
jgi:membrane protein required for colicin V production